MPSGVNGDFFETGRYLPASARCYVERRADSALYQGLKEGQFCYVLNARQMGKSSLRHRTATKLSNQDKKPLCVEVDLSNLGGTKDPSEWYAGFAELLLENSSQGVDRDFDDFDKWWENHRGSPTLRLRDFIKKFLLSRTEEQVIIFIDEIEGVQECRLDDFFGLIRYFYNERARCSDYERLAFAVFGVVSPNELLSDAAGTPFNILTKGIELTGFTSEEAKCLTDGLRERVNYPKQILEEILSWTGGQPHLTQKLCILVNEHAHLRHIDVEKLVRTEIITNWRTQDNPEHLRTIENYISGAQQHHTRRMVVVYQEILEKGSVRANNSPEQYQLRLSGLVVKQNDSLRVFNRIYREVFDEEWIQIQLDSLRPYAKALSAWINSGREGTIHLLNGAELKDAQKLASEKSLPSDDYQFIQASQKTEVEEIRLQVVAAESEKQRAIEERDQADQEAIISKRNGRRLLTFSGLATLGFASGASLIWYQADKSAQAARKQATEARSETRVAEWKALVTNLRRHTATIGVAEEQWKVKFAEGRLDDLEEDLSEKNSELEDTKREAASARQQTAITQDQLAQAEGALDDTTRSLESSRIELDSVESKLSANEVLLASAEQERQVAEADREKERKARELEEEATELRRLFNEMRGESNLGQLEILVQATKLLKDLKDITKDEDNIEGYPGVGPAFTVQDILSKISEVNYFRGHDEEITHTEFSPDGNFFLTSSIAGSVKLWGRNGKPIASFGGPNIEQQAAKISPDGTRIATASYYRDEQDYKVVIWDIKGNLLQAFDQAHHSNVTDIDFSPDGKQIASSSEDGTAKIWSLDDGSFQLLKHSDAVNDIEFSPDGTHIVTAGKDGKVRLFDGQGKALRDFLPYPRELYFVGGQSVGSVEVATFSLDGSMIITSPTLYGGIKRWDLNWNDKGTLFEQVKKFSLIPNTNLIGIVARSGVDIKALGSDKSFPSLVGHQGVVSSFSFSPDGTLGVTASNNGIIKIWDMKRHLAEGGEGIDVGPISSASFSVSSDKLETAIFNSQRSLSSDLPSKIKILDRSGKIRQQFDRPANIDGREISLSPNGEVIAAFSPSEHISLPRLLEVPTLSLLSRNGEVLRIFDKSLDFAEVRFSPDSSMIGAITSQRTARIWTIDGELLFDSGEEDFGIGEMDVKQSINSFDFDPQGRFFTTGYNNGVVKLWSLNDDFLPVAFEAHEGAVSAVTISPDGTKIATAGKDGTKSLWNVNGKKISSLGNDQDRITRIKFSSDGQLIGTLSSSGVIRLRTLSGKLISRFDSGISSFLDFTFTPDSQEVVYVTSSGILGQRPITPRSLYSEACERLANHLAINPEAAEVCSETSDARDESSASQDTPPGEPSHEPQLTPLPSEKLPPKEQPLIPSFTAHPEQLWSKPQFAASSSAG